MQHKARAAAVEELKDKAGQIAALAGVELGRLVYTTELGGPIVASTARAERAFFAASAAPAPIQARELEVTVSLQAAFEITQKDK